MQTQTLNVSGASGSIKERAMLASIQISQWTGSIHDKRITKEVADTHGSDVDFGRYSKRLVAKKALAKIAQAAGEARREHYHYTLPWTDDGSRILPSNLYIPHTTALRKCETAFWNGYDELEQNYDDVKAEAKAALNGLFQESNYPSKAKLKTKYGFNVLILPMPEVTDFRLDLSDSVLDRIKRDTAETLKQTFSNTTMDCWKRLHKVVATMSQSLKEYNVLANGKVENPFRNSLIGNVIECVDILPDLNIVGDVDLDSLIRTVRTELLQSSSDTAYVADALRENDGLRKSVADKSDEIMRLMGGYMSGYESE